MSSCMVSSCRVKQILFIKQAYIYRRYTAMKFTVSFYCLGGTNSCQSCDRKRHVLPSKCIFFRTLDSNVTRWHFSAFCHGLLPGIFSFLGALASIKIPMCDPSSSTALLLPSSCFSPLVFGWGAKSLQWIKGKKGKSEEGQVRKKFKMPEVCGYSSRIYGSGVLICFSQQEAGG